MIYRIDVASEDEAEERGREDGELYSTGDVVDVTHESTEQVEQEAGRGMAAPAPKLFIDLQK